MANDKTTAVFKKVFVADFKLCSECGYNNGQPAVIKLATYAVPLNVSDRLFSGDDANLINARYLCDEHFKQSKYNDSKYSTSVGRVVCRARRTG